MVVMVMHAFHSGRVIGSLRTQLEPLDLALWSLMLAVLRANVMGWFYMSKMGAQTPYINMIKT